MRLLATTKTMSSWIEEKLAKKTRKCRYSIGSRELSKLRYLYKILNEYKKRVLDISIRFGKKKTIEKRSKHNNLIRMNLIIVMLLNIKLLKKWTL